jgi:hypothetical protein
MPTLRGEVCIGSASFFTFVATLLLIFAHVGQINTGNVPRGISLANMNITDFGTALAAATGDPKPGLYNTTDGAPLGVHLGLRHQYSWGAYSYCAFTTTVNGSNTICTSTSFPKPFRPGDAILDDTPERPTNYTVQVRGLLKFDQSDFTNSDYLGYFSTAAFWFMFLGTLGTVTAFITGLVKSRTTFWVATSLAVFSTLCIMISASIYTAIVGKAQGINSAQWQPPSGPPVPLGIVVTFGNALWLQWTAFICLFLSIVPYVISCCTYR